MKKKRTIISALDSEEDDEDEEEEEKEIKKDIKNVVVKDDSQSKSDKNSNDEDVKLGKRKMKMVSYKSEKITKNIETDASIRYLSLVLKIKNRSILTTSFKFLLRCIK